jgi:PAS domain S-box-containing protein
METTELSAISAAQFEALFRQAPLGIVVIEASGLICAANSKAEHILAELRGRIVGRSLEEVVSSLWSAEHASQILSLFQRAVEKGESVTTEQERGAGEFYQWRFDRVPLPDGRFNIACYFQDTSDRTRAAINANLLASIVESSDDAIVGKNLDAVIVSWNRAAQRLFGYTAEEAVGQPISILFPPDRLDEEPKILERLKRGERVDHFETIRVRKDGRKMHVSLTISPIRDSQGKIVGASKIARDITDRVYQQKALEEANTALQQANADLQQFAYSASHDLQEPLRMIAAYSDLLQKKFAGKLGAAADEYIGHIIEGAARMQRLLKDLRTYMLATTSDQPASEVSSIEILEKTLAALEVAIKQSHATITTGCLPRVVLHEFQLQQIFQNLIGNAIRYCRAEPPRIHITAVPHGPKGEEWLFRVEDNGIGIEPEFKEHVFGIFKRLHSAADYPGTGMGLAICQRIVERSGGRIWVESEPGRGSTFYFTLPRST